MVFFGLHFQFINLVIVASVTSSFAVKVPPNYPISKPNCTDRCGRVTIPFPFGTTKDCYLSKDFFVTCNQTLDPPKTFLRNTTIEITDISLDGQLTVLQYIGKDCYDRNGTRIVHNVPWIHFSIFFTVNNTANKFVVVGCDTYGSVSGEWLDREYRTGCNAMCKAKDDLPEGSCAGLGCCQISIPKHVWKVQLELKSYDNYSNVKDFNDCGYAFLVEESAFTFSPENLTNLRNVEENGLPMVVDWAIGNGTCEEAKMNYSAYACKSAHSKCYKPDNGDGYRCSCKQGYRGNPYLVNGCHDIDECQDPSLNKCEKRCVNKPGGFECVCPKGYHGDGRRGGRGCIRGESLIFKLVAGVALGVIFLLVPGCWFHMKLKRRRVLKMRRKLFLQNGGALLQEKLTTSDRSPLTAKIFSVSELQKATSNFHSSKIIGRGGFGTVYKGILPNNTIVAIKKSREVDPKQIEQFINEVIILSQINHRNVVKLLGCCLETQVPLLVYEFINNGTLYEHIHDEEKARFLSWDTRLRIAAETAGVLSYLHSAASTPIIHRDVKSANILLNHNFTAKVSDFGASRLVPLNQTQLSTLVQGTFGYLDPEYMQTNQLSAKSDVYSFGVVLVELLTGKKALSYDRPEEERNLAIFFLYAMKRDRLFGVVDESVVREGNREQLMRVAVLAERCLKVRGDERPFMKEVAMELEGLIVGVKQSWPQTEDEGFMSGLINNNSTYVGFDSLNSILSMSGGR